MKISLCSARFISFELHKAFVVSVMLGYGMNNLWFASWPIPPPILWVLWALFPGIKQPEGEVVLGLRM